MTRITLALGFAVAIAGGGVATAGTISGTTATDPTVDGALTGGTVVGFDSTTSGLYASLTIGNVTFTGVDASFTIGTDYNGSYNTRGGKSLFNDFDLVPTAFRFDFGTSVSAFAFMWGAADSTWTLTAYDSTASVVDSLVVSPTGGGNAGDYFGITGTDIKYATLVYSGAGDYVFIDNFTHSASAGAVVPLPPSALMGLSLLGGMGVMAWLRRRRIAEALAH